MLLCYLADQSNPNAPVDLYIVPDKFDPLAAPIKVKILEPLTAAVYRVSSDETFMVTVDPEDNRRVIVPIDPTPLYLTPNLNDRPGFRVRRLKVYVDESGAERTFYARDRGGWEEFIANSERK